MFNRFLTQKGADFNSSWKLEGNCSLYLPTSVVSVTWKLLVLSYVVTEKSYYHLKWFSNYTDLHKLNKCDQNHYFWNISSACYVMTAKIYSASWEEKFRRFFQFAWLQFWYNKDSQKCTSILYLVFFNVFICTENYSLLIA